MDTVRTWCFVLLLTVSGGRAVGVRPTGGEAPQERPSVREHQIKAAWLLNFARFTTWPKKDLSPKAKQMVVGVVGEEAFAKLLANSLRNKKAQGKAIVVRRYVRISDVKGCQILFVSRSLGAQETRKLLKQLGNRGVLSVGETAGFADRGGCVNFVKSGTKLHFEVNLGRLRRLGIAIKSRVLKLAARKIK